MDKRICPVCGKEFIPNTDNQVCCSSHCAAIKNGIETRKYRKCLYCGKLFWIPNASKCRLRYCCDECKQKAHEERYSKKEKPVKQPKRKVCAWCGREFEAFTNTSFCSKQCGYEANNKLQRERWREKYKPKRLICKECGKEFVTECGDTHSVFCCSACAKANEKRQERQTDRHKRAVARSKEIRKKQIKKNFVEDVAYEDIYERDNGVCQICGMPVPFEKGCDDNWDGTIDHIIPLSKGGEHSMENCQLAHRICNSLKGREKVSHINWKKLAKEDLYWKRKLDLYNGLMSA